MPHRVRDTNHSSSLNLLPTSSASAATTASACGPVAETVMVVPGPAESIIRPMIEVPPTVSPPRVTRISASNCSTILTNFAEARACRPRLLMMGIRAVHYCRTKPRRRSVSDENPAGDGDVFPPRLLRHGDGVGQRALLAHL